MADIYIQQSISVDVDDFLDNCSKHELTEVINWLKDRSELEEEDLISNKLTYSEVVLRSCLKTIEDHLMSLSQEEESFLINLSNRF